MEYPKMTPTRKAGRPASQAIRWPISTAAREFGRDHKTLSRALTRLEESPGQDGRFSTLQIVAALYGDKAAEDLRKTRLQADQIDMANQERRKELVPTEDVYRFCEGVFIALREKILALPCEQQDKDDMLRDIQKLTYDQVRKASFGGELEEADSASDTAAEAV